MGHIPPGYGTASCPTNIVTYTDNPVVADQTQPRAIHRNEIRNAIVTEGTRRGLSATPLPNTNQPVVTDINTWRKIHLDELRAAIDYMKAPSERPAHSCPTNSDAYCPANTFGWCPSDASASWSWTDPAITADQDLIRAIHINELRVNLSAEMVVCVCEQEACNYCSDCGYAYEGCSFSPCACDDHKYAECGHSHYWVYSCATINNAGTWVPQNAPWNCMCNFTPPGINWAAYGVPHAPGYNHPEWGCLCNPFNWTS